MNHNKNQLKLFIWEEVLCDYGEGIMFAYAYDADQARELIKKKMGYESEDLEIEPREVTEPEGFFVYGGQ